MGERSFLRPIGSGCLASSSVMGCNKCFRIKGMNNQGYSRPIFESMSGPGQANFKVLWSVRVDCIFCNLSIEVFCLMKTQSFSTSSLFHILSGLFASIDQH